MFQQLKSLISSNIAIGLLAALCWLTLTNGQSSSDTFDPSAMCALVPNGTFINNPGACNSWFECVDEQPIAGTCASGLFYDLANNTCVAEDSIKCVSSDPCAATPDGFAADPYSCNGYYYCTDGSGAKGTCSSGLNFNPATMSCIRGFECTLSDPDSYCNIVPEGVFIANTTSCNGWEMCWEDEIVSGTCPGTFYYNAFSGDCDFPENVNCTAQVDTPLSGEGICPEAGAFVPDNSTCNGYYYCRETTNDQIILQHGDCPAGRFFDPNVQNGACVQQTQYACPYDRCAGMGMTAIQLANAPNDGCKGYLVCQYGVTIGSGVCPNDEYFDELTQLCTPEEVFFPACIYRDQPVESTSSETSPTTTETSTTESTTESTTTTTTESTTTTTTPEPTTTTTTTESTTTTTTPEPTTTTTTTESTTTTTTPEPTTTTTTTESTTTSTTDSSSEETTPLAV